MASLEDLPADQRSVLQLVLGHGRSYSEIEKILGVDRAGVRERALAALDALGPSTRLPDESRALISDYLLGQLPAGAQAVVRRRIAGSPSERAWARVLSSELRPLAKDRLPEVPVELEEDGDDARERDREETRARRRRDDREERPTRVREERRERRVRELREEPGEPDDREERDERLDGLTATAEPSRRGGAILLGLAAAVVVVIVIILIASGGSSKRHPSSTASRGSSTTSSATNVSGSPQVVAQINLNPPTSGTKAAGVAFVVKQGSNIGISIRAQNVPPNSKHDAYAVWLYNSPTDSKILGFVNPGVGSNGQLSTAGGLPSNASHYKQLLVTLETQQSPRTPGKIVLQGQLTGVS